MKIEKNTVVLLRYTMRNSAGDLLEDKTNAPGFTYVHGSGNLFPALENEMTGLSVGDTKTFSIHDKLLHDVFHFEVFVDDIRVATPVELMKGFPEEPMSAVDCGPGCAC
ncbi:FKBP-type peptidyl-prolyl cis-trans isomerase [Flavihumibacter fluvii]|uniref:FKBP-type peptidyl-prolyl cis-trans isomerase n=1 Tax=Flavihumibacter fluvii TaxID=2838157 RepID=UPI001BDE178F|nr:FKBP-type peptidyl-prolyl cis-trans isomerase [Flavihumibacter fluvii]ULQ50848.1 FKBP-type peptidyl-prolyl cis-trans isomerase [Flavihumibacter fluvii]